MGFLCITGLGRQQSLELRYGKHVRRQFSQVQGLELRNQRIKAY